METVAGKSVLVTGGAGFIGSHVVDRLVDRGARRIVVVDNLWLGTRENLRTARSRHRRIRLYVADATRLRTLREIVRREKVEVVFSLATIPLPASHERPRWAAETITRMAVVVAELARLGEFQTLVQCSSSEVYGSAVRVPMTEDHTLNPLTPYAAAKAAADLVVSSYWETFDIDATIIRPFNTYGPRQNARGYAGVVPITLRRIRSGLPPVVFGDGSQTRDYVFVEDTAEAIVRGYERTRSRRRPINVGSGREVRIADLVDTLCRLARYEGAPTFLPERKADVRRHLADTTLAREILDFTPRIGLEEGLRRTVESYSARDGQLRTP